MKVARLYDFLDVRIEEQPVPVIGPGEALVRARACGICSGDVVPWYIRKKAPLVFGHEPVGEIVAVGAGVSGFAPGDRVFVHHHAPCFRCRACARGEFVQCPTWKQSQIDPGGMAEFFRVPAGNLVRRHAAPAGSCLGRRRRAGRAARLRGEVARRAPATSNGATVLIIGLGVMGQLHVLLARHLGAARILAADLVAERCAVAAQLGADVTIDAGAAPLAEQVRALTDGEGAEIVIVGPGDGRGDGDRPRLRGARRYGGPVHGHRTGRDAGAADVRLLLPRASSGAELFVRAGGDPPRTRSDRRRA